MDAEVCVSVIICMQIGAGCFEGAVGSDRDDSVSEN